MPIVLTVDLILRHCGICEILIINENENENEDEDEDEDDNYNDNDNDNDIIMITLRFDEQNAVFEVHIFNSKDTRTVNT